MSSKRAFGSVTTHIGKTDEYTKTKAELEGLPAAEMDTSNEVTATTNPAFVFEALRSADMTRLDFNFGGTPIKTHGYESPGNRAADAHTLHKFGYGPIKVGDGDVGAYEQILDAGKDIRGPENQVLTSLEMFRIPETSPMLGLKRDLYEQGKTKLSEAMAIDSPKSNVEFKGAVGGSGLKKDQKKRMRLQQILSNEKILNDYAKRYADHEIGYALTGKARATPKQVKAALDKFVTDKDKLSKQQFRRKLKRVIASVLSVQGFNSDEEVSDVDEQHYKENDDW